MKLSRSPSRLLPLAALIGTTFGLAAPVWASSHREAPNIAMNPTVDATDLYMFRSYETGRAGFVTILANYIPFQDPQGGPNFYQFNPNALYEIHIDNTGAGKEALTFQFRFTSTSKSHDADRRRQGRQDSADRRRPVAVAGRGPGAQRQRDLHA